jgi:hypothetical protein
LVLVDLVFGHLVAGWFHLLHTEGVPYVIPLSVVYMTAVGAELLSLLLWHQYVD